MILETLALTVGFAISKSLLRIWLKDHPIAESAAGSVMDMLKPFAGNILAARQGTREFEKLGDKVAKSLVPVFESSKLEESAVEAVANEVGLTIAEADVSAKLLASISYKPSLLLEHFKQNRPINDKQYSEAELMLYYRALGLSAQYLIDLAANLPDYTSQNFTEILQRLDVQMAKLDDVLADLEQMRVTSETGNKEQHYAEFETLYRGSIARRLENVELIGASVDRRMRRYLLTTSYTSLYVTGPSVGGAGENNRVAVETALSRAERVAITGDAGSGKTTLLQWLAVNSAINSFNRQMLQWQDKVPFFIELRRFVDAPPPPERFLEKVLPEIANEMPRSWVHELLKRGRALLLVDGLDEVQPAKRRTVVDWLEGILASFPQTRVVITSRPAAYKERQLSHLGFTEFRLAPMDIREVESFVDNWHDAVLKEQNLETEAQIDVIKDRLLFRLQNNLPLMRLATNPLLCAMICALHYDRRMQLPAGRNELYEACCSMLLERRDAEREIQTSQGPQLSYRQKRVILDDLAYWMMKNDYSSIALSQAKEKMSLRLSNMQLTPSPVDPNTVLGMLVERSGILRLPTPETIDFIHRTFQEYMAASAAALEGDWGLLRNHSSEYLWHETIVLAAGFANRKEADELIGDLLQRGNTESHNSSSYDLLAIACLETAPETSDFIRERVAERLRALIPPKFEGQWRSLASAGDLAIPHLSAKPDYSEKDAAACIQVLGLIGNIAALKKLSTYADDRREKVVESFENVLTYFSSEMITESGLAEALLQALSCSASGGRLRLSGAQVHALSALSLEQLMTSIPNVAHLDLVNCRPSDVYVLSIFPNVTSLTLSGDIRIEFELINRLRGLKILDLRNESDVWPVGGLRKLSNLRKLYSLRLLSRSDSWPDFNELAVLPKLKKLSLFSEWSVDFPEFEDFARWANLEYLHLAAISGIWPDISPLADLANLRELELSIVSGELPPNLLRTTKRMVALKKLKINLGNVDNDKTFKLQQRLSESLSGCAVSISQNWVEANW